MNLFDVFFVIVCGIGSLNSLLLSAYYFLNKKGDSFLNKVLGLFILSYSLRVGKTVWVFFFKAIHPFYDIVWFFAFAATVLLYTLYVFAMTSDSASDLNRAKRNSTYLAVFILIVISLFIYDFEMPVFLTTLVFFVVAMVYTIKRIVKYPFDGSASGKMGDQWLKTLSVFMLLIFIDFALILVVRFKFLYVEAFLFSGFVYYLAYLEIKHGFISKIHKGAKEPVLVDNKVLEQLRELMEAKKLYLDPQITLPVLSKSITISPHYLSRLLNESFGVNFNDYVNRYRIEEAKLLLVKPENQSSKISSLAFECGFNSLSVFNAAFKKFTGKTPSQYQAEILGR